MADGNQFFSNNLPHGQRNIFGEVEGHMIAYVAGEGRRRRRKKGQMVAALL
jgi:hypothetical protein